MTEPKRELKPCPFCGGEPFRYYSGSRSNGEFLEIICDNCGCRTARLKEDIATKAWNRRAKDETKPRTGNRYS